MAKNTSKKIDPQTRRGEGQTPPGLSAFSLAQDAVKVERWTPAATQGSQVENEMERLYRRRPTRCSAAKG